MIDPIDVSTIRFSTEGLAEKDRVPMWREYYGRSLLKVDMEPAPDVPFRCDVTVRSLPGLQLLSGRSSAMCITRSRASIADGNDDLILTVNRTGSALASSRGRDIELRGGDAVLMSGAEVTTFQRVGPGSSVSIQVPRTALAPLVENIGDAVMQHIPGHIDALRLLASYATPLFAEDVLQSPGLHELVAGHVNDLIALTLSAADLAAGAAADRGVRAARLQAAKIYIAAHSDQQGLSIQHVATHLGVTVRYLQRLFERDGTTFSAFLLDRRLADAHRMLCEADFDRLPVGAIAYDAGFGDLSYFNRRFRKLYGLTPRDIRETGKAALR
ncbi:AraC family transcriptional regulator [Bradyrhizobium prioriisuperbiae]|uniref:AraC family transcriptional regulator n=1 Tax=Bradyrhizobium prioriisuperbiae TaxID=2854389 RepID=UPI0028EF180A|nr:AraC family transcriptional regulator [Bradyrhizobium prioritasuperba]